MAITDADAQLIASHVWRYVLSATEGGGVSLPAESAAGRLAAVRRSTHGAAADRTHILGRIEAVSAQVETLRRIVVDTHPNPYTGTSAEEA